MKNTQTTGPVLIHVITDKGRGYDPAVSASDRMHGVGKFDKATGKQFKTKSKVSVAGPWDVSITATVAHGDR